MKLKLTLLLIVVLAAFLRFFYLEHNPAGFYSDEASYAYNAYSILESGRDEHGKAYPLVFEAFGDYKLPVMLYSIVGSFVAFGPSEWSARVPGALYGSLTVILVFLFTKKIFTTYTEQQELRKKASGIGLIAALFIAISPSHIFVSRGTWELTPALFFICLGAYCTLHVIESNTQKNSVRNALYTAGAAFSYILSMYSYNSARVFIPLFIIGIIVLFFKRSLYLIKQHKLVISTIIIASIVLLLPILTTLTRPEVTQRAKYISIFYDLGVESKLFGDIKSDAATNTLVIRLFHNKPLYYLADFSQRYVSHFSPNFLFITGDTFEIFKLVDLGFLPLLTAPFLIFGFIKILTVKEKWRGIILLWLILSPIASALTIFTPSSSRSMNMIIPLAIMAAFGVVEAITYIQKKWKEPAILPAYAFFIALIIVNTAYVFNRYFIQTPKVVAEKWNDGFKETVEYMSKIEKNYDKIVISSAKAPSYIFYAWDMQYDPKKYQAEAVTDHTPDEHGLNFTSQFGKYYFTKDIASEITNKNTNEKILFIGFPDEFKNETRIIYSQNNKPVFILKEN